MGLYVCVVHVKGSAGIDMNSGGHGAVCAHRQAQLHHYTHTSSKHSGEIMGFVAMVEAPQLLRPLVG